MSSKATSFATEPNIFAREPSRPPDASRARGYKRACVWEEVRTTPAAIARPSALIGPRCRLWRFAVRGRFLSSPVSGQVNPNSEVNMLLAVPSPSSQVNRLSCWRSRRSVSRPGRRRVPRPTPSRPLMMAPADLPDALNLYAATSFAGLMTTAGKHLLVLIARSCLCTAHPSRRCPIDSRSAALAPIIYAMPKMNPAVLVADTPLALRIAPGAPRAKPWMTMRGSQPHRRRPPCTSRSTWMKRKRIGGSAPISSKRSAERSWWMVRSRSHAPSD